MQRALPILLLVVGVLMFLVFLTADASGIGEGTGIGWKQITGSVFGVIMAAAGITQLRKKDTD